MNQNVILIAGGAQVLVLVLALLGGKIPAFWVRAALVVSSLISVVCAGIAIGHVNDGSGTVEWVNKGWFSFGDESVFAVALRAGSWESLLWFVLGIFFLVYDYKSLVTTRSYFQGHAIARCVMAIGTLLCVLSGNFITYFTGASINAFALFLAIALEYEESKSSVGMSNGGAAFRYFGFTFVGHLLLLVGMLGLGSGSGSLPFDGLPDIVSGAIIPTWAVTALFTLGMMAAGMQIPALCLPRYVGTAGRLSPLLLFAGLLLMAPVLPVKLYSYLTQDHALHHFAIIPAVTCLFAAFFAVSERKRGNLEGWLCAYAIGSSYIAAFHGGYHPALIGAVAAAIALLLMTTALEEDLVPARVKKPFLLIGALAFMGVPLSAMGYGRIQEYASVVMRAQDGSPVSWIVLSLKVVADALAAVACWRIVYLGPWQSVNAHRGKEPDSVWRGAVLLGLLTLACLSAVMGGRPLSGILGEMESSTDPRVAWFERFVVPPGDVHSISNDAELTARILLLAVLLTAALFSIFWAFREQKRGEEFVDRWEQITKKLDLQRLLEYLIWDLAFSKLGGWLGRLAAKADDITFEALDEHVVARPFTGAAGMFKFLDDRALDQGLIEGAGKAVVKIGDVVKLLQSGNLHRYILFGLIVTALALLAAVLRTGA